MVKINPLEYITPEVVVPEAALEVKRWFKTETIELNFGEWAGSPMNTGNFIQKEFLGWFLAQGWYVDSVSAAVTGGSWESRNDVITSINSSASTTNESRGGTESSAKASGLSNTSGSHRPIVQTWDTTAETRSSADFETNTSTSNNTDVQGTGSSRTVSDTNVQSIGGTLPTAYSYARYRLKRRRMQTEEVLDDMIKEFTKAYNEGRRINNKRYDELVGLYSIMLDRTEDEVGRADDAYDKYRGLVDKILPQIEGALKRFDKNTAGIMDSFGDGQRQRIDLQFNALQSKAFNDLISRGISNSASQPTIRAGIERERQFALSGVEDEIVKTQVDIEGRLVGIKADILGKIEQSAARLLDAMSRRAFAPTEIRNNVFRWMLEFMEKREDEYPSLSEAVGLVQGMGYGEGANVAPTS